MACKSYVLGANEYWSSDCSGIFYIIVQMPNLKGKVVAPSNKVTWVTWKTKRTTRGPVTNLVRDASKSPVKKSGSTTSSPTKHPATQSTVPSTPDADCSQHPDVDMDDFEPLGRLRIHTKVDHVNPTIPTANLFTIFQTQNDYLREWTSQKDDYLHALLEMEGPPTQKACSMCGAAGTYRCNDCFHRPLFCAQCCRERHGCVPFHRIDKWTGHFFDDSSLHLVSTAGCNTLSCHSSL